MTFEIDHIFVCADTNAPEAAQLEALGLTRGPSAAHQGQGSANQCFVFHNAYLELIWIHNESEARSPLTQSIRLFDRWQNRAAGACPFGICFRPVPAPDASGAPFAKWNYMPQYAPPSRPIQVGNNSQLLNEPMLFFIESASRPDSRDKSLPMQHRLGVRELTRVTWTRPTDVPLSPEMQAVVASGCIAVESGPTHTLTIGFDHQANGSTARLLPALPLTLQW